MRNIMTSQMFLPLYKNVEFFCMNIKVENSCSRISITTIYMSFPIVQTRIHIAVVYVGVPNGTNCAPLHTEFVLNNNESDFLQDIS